jgi:hypothetical protein
MFAGFGYSRLGDPKVSDLADRPGWKLTPTAEEIERQQTDGTFNPSELRVTANAVLLKKSRRILLAVGLVSLVAAGVTALMAS